MHRSKLGLIVLVACSVALNVSHALAETFSTLVSFNGTDGEFPYGSLTLSGDGSTLYGMTNNGGANYSGSLFSVPVTGGTPTTLFSFDGTNGSLPRGNVALSGSTLYGMTTGGGSSAPGTVFSVPNTGGTPTTLATFTGPDGQHPLGSLTLSGDGSTLYGMTNNGGANSLGTIFSEPAAGGTPTTLFNFDGTHGEQPYGSLTLSADGSTLYGMTAIGGIHDGVVFSMPVSGGTPTVLLAFNGANGNEPVGDLTLVGSTLYGMTSRGGLLNDGVVFSVPVTGGSPTLLATFNGTNGAMPDGDLTLIGSTLYGMTSAGGATGLGTIFSLPLAGGTPTTLVSFNGTNGASPSGSFTQSGSTLYGMTSEGGANYGINIQSFGGNVFVGQGTIFALNLAPEPSSVLLLGLGAIGLLVVARRKQRAPAWHGRG